MRRALSREELLIVVNSSTSKAEVLRKLGIPLGGGNYRNLSIKIAAFSISTDHFTGARWNKGRKTALKRNTEDYLTNKVYISSGKLKIRLFREGLLEQQCSMCFITEWNGHPAPLELDHINGNPADNSLKNLRILCPNCHAQTPTYRNRSRVRPINFTRVEVRPTIAAKAYVDGAPNLGGKKPIKEKKGCVVCKKDITYRKGDRCALHRVYRTKSS